MSKELDTLKRLICIFKPYVVVSHLIREDFNIIEDALKRLAVYETFDLLDEKDDVDKLTDIKGKLTYVDKVMDTQERLLESVSADEIRILNSVLNSQIKTLKKKLKALKIIKNKRVDVDLFYTVIEDENQTDKLWSYNFWQNNKNKLTQEEFDLLKEVLK